MYLPLAITSTAATFITAHYQHDITHMCGNIQHHTNFKLEGENAAMRELKSRAVLLSQVRSPCDLHAIHGAGLLQDQKEALDPWILHSGVAHDGPAALRVARRGRWRGLRSCVTRIAKPPTAAP